MGQERCRNWNLLTDMKGENLAYAYEQEHSGTVALFLPELDSAVREEVRLDCMGGFVISMVYGFSRPTADLDVLEIAPGEAGRPILELGMKDGPLHNKYKIYLDHVGVVHVPEDYKDRLTEIFPKAFKHLRLLPLTRMTLLCQSWNATSNVTETM
jgi:hypothetical protein